MTNQNEQNVTIDIESAEDLNAVSNMCAAIVVSLMAFTLLVVVVQFCLAGFLPAIQPVIWVGIGMLIAVTAEAGNTAEQESKELEAKSAKKSRIFCFFGKNKQAKA